MMESERKDVSEEIKAISTVYDALKALDTNAIRRVLGYVTQALGVTVSAEAVVVQRSDRIDVHDAPEPADTSADKPDAEPVDVVDGISPVAAKWMRRNQLDAQKLGDLFSLGLDDIDLVAPKLPGNSKKDRMRNVFLLKGIAAYLGSGAARFDHESLRSACQHYDAWDTDNFAQYLKAFVSLVSGSRESGYQLTARGLTAGTQLVKELLAGESSANS